MFRFYVTFVFQELPFEHAVSMHSQCKLKDIVSIYRTIYPSGTMILFSFVVCRAVFLVVSFSRCSIV